MITVMILPSSIEKLREGEWRVIRLLKFLIMLYPYVHRPIKVVLQFYTLGIYLQGPGGNRDSVTQFVRVLDQIDRREWANNTIKRAQDCYHFETSLAPCVNDAVAAVIICRNEYAYSALLS